MTEREIAFMTKFNSSVINFVYSKGYVRSDDNVFIKCKACGEETQRTGGFLRKVMRNEKTVICRSCEGHRISSSPLHTVRIRDCRECGESYTSVNGSVYCADVCKHKNRNRRIEIKRRMRLGASVFDSSINIDKLMLKENGVCYLCGNECDPDDYQLDSQGHFIVGPYYPSIEHVVPLSKGGTHTEVNVRLAHHYCNLIKSNK